MLLSNIVRRILAEMPDRRLERLEEKAIRLAQILSDLERIQNDQKSNDKSG